MSIWPLLAYVPIRINELDFFHRLSKGYEKLHFPQMIVSASSYVMDLTKDVLMVIQISIAQGGLKKILKHPQPYMAGVRKE